MYSGLTADVLSRHLATETSTYHLLGFKAPLLHEEHTMLTPVNGGNIRTSTLDIPSLTATTASLLMGPRLPPLRRSRSLPMSLDHLGNQADFGLSLAFEAQRQRHIDAAKETETARRSLTRLASDSELDTGWTYPDSHDGSAAQMSNLA
jgi:hypothetical protein